MWDLSRSSENSTVRDYGPCSGGYKHGVFTLDCNDENEILVASTLQIGNTSPRFWQITASESVFFHKCIAISNKVHHN